MANTNERPNLKICIDNTDEGSLSGDDVRLEDDAQDIIEEDALSGSGEEESEPEGEDADMERAILEANVPEDELEEFPSETQTVTEVKPEVERVAPKPQRLKIAPSEKEKLEDVDIEAMYDSLGFTIAGLEKSNDRGIRLEAIHMRGTEGLEEADIMLYFQQFSPTGVEWIDDESCNVTWSDPMKAAHAMLKLSATSQLSANDSDSDDDSQETMETDQTMKRTGSLDDDDADRETGEKKSGEKGGDDMDVDDGETENKENRSTVKRRSRLKVPPGRWRIGVAHPKAQVLFFRFANKADVPLPGAEHRRKFRKKFTAPRIGSEGLISESRRRELKVRQDELEVEKAKEAMLKQQRPLQDQSIPDFLLEDVPELPEEFAAYPDPKPAAPKPRQLYSKSSIEEHRLRMKRKRCDSEDSPETDVEEELKALLKPKAEKRLPIGRMHADEEEEKIEAVRNRSLDPSHVDPTDARSLILKRQHKKRKLVTSHRRLAPPSDDESWEDDSDQEEEDHDSFGVSRMRSSGRRSRHDRSRRLGYRSRDSRRGAGRHSRDARPNLKDLPSLTIQVEAD